jgi:SH3-like domain-containing protein
MIAMCALIGSASGSRALAQVVDKPLPRFASLKADPVDVRRGPSRSEPTLWTYQRAGVPVEVISLSGAFAQVRDVEGAQGWVPVGVLSARRTAVVSGSANGRTTLHAERRDSANAVAELEGGLIVSVAGCDGTWCQLTVGALRGYLPQARLWGVYPGEVLD